MSLLFLDPKQRVIISSTVSDDLHHDTPFPFVATTHHTTPTPAPAHTHTTPTPHHQQHKPTPPTHPYIPPPPHLCAWLLSSPSRSSSSAFFFCFSSYHLRLAPWLLSSGPASPPSPFCRARPTGSITPHHTHYMLYRIAPCSITCRGVSGCMHCDGDRCMHCDGDGRQVPQSCRMHSTHVRWMQGSFLDCHATSISAAGTSPCSMR